MLDVIVKNTKEYMESHSKENRKKKGQFFTSVSIAEFMAIRASYATEHLSILEPGAGNGLLTAAVIKYCIENELCHSFDVKFVENDIEIISVLEKTSGIMKEFVNMNHGDISISISTDKIDRDLWQKDARLDELGIHVLSQSGNLPDIIAYDTSEKRILFIEAYHSAGPFTLDRVNAIKALCQCESGTEAAFITAFDTTSKMLKNYKDVAWDTDIWSADEPTHLLHKNGDKFIGRPL